MVDHSSASDITQAEKSWISWLRNPKLATIVAQEVERHRDTPKFCVCVIWVCPGGGPLPVPRWWQVLGGATKKSRIFRPA